MSPINIHIIIINRVDVYTLYPRETIKIIGHSIIS